MKKKKKVLIITYYWPPSGGPGVQRVLKFVKYLVRAHWDVVLLTVKDGEYPAIDEDLVKEIPPECQVYKTKSVDYFSYYKQLTGKKKSDKIDTFVLGEKKSGLMEKISKWTRLNLFIPDGRIGWKNYAIKEGKKIIAKEQPDIIFSSSPPHSLQLIAYELAQSSSLPWVADYRDPWTEAFWEKFNHRTSWADKKNIAYEEKMLQKADKIITVSEGAKQLLRTNLKEKITVIYNGFDREDFKPSANVMNKKFTIIYTGGISKSQCPNNFFKAIAQLPDNIKEQIQIDFYGKQDASVWDSIHKNNISTIVKNHGYVSHRTVLEKMSTADVLLLLIPQQHSLGIMTGKIYEYFASNRFILGFGDENEEQAKIIRTCQAGVMINYDKDPSSIIMQQYNAWKNNIPFQSNSVEIDKYSRENITRSLINVFEECL